MNGWTQRMWYDGGRHAGHPLDWVSQTASTRFAQNVRFASVLTSGFADADPDDVQLQELTWPGWESGS